MIHVALFSALLGFQLASLEFTAKTVVYHLRVGRSIFCIVLLWAAIVALGMDI